MHPGTRIGPYEITVPIGTGGMGEVFRARDMRLNRDVAVKVLPKEFAKGADQFVAICGCQLRSNMNKLKLTLVLLCVFLFSRSVFGKDTPTTSTAGQNRDLGKADAEPSPLPAREGFINVDGGPVWYRIAGSGSQIPLLIVHGGPGSRSCIFDKVAGFWGKSRPVITYDQLGSGRSGRPTDRNLWTLERSVRELEQVREALGLSKIHLLGHSWGAGLAVSYLDRAGLHGIESVVLLGPYLSTKIWIEDANLLLAQLPDEVQATLKRHEAAGTTQSPEYEKAAELFYSRFYYHKPKPQLPPSCAEAKRNDEIYQHMWGPTEFRATGTLRDFDVTSVLPRLRVPVLLVVGRFDEARPETAARFQAMIPKARLEIIEDCGHMAAVDDPDALARIVGDFLRAPKK